MISVTGALQAKIDLNKAGKLARKLNTEMKRYQAVVDAGDDYEIRLILLDAADAIMDTVDKLKDVKHDLVKLERDIAFSGGR